MAAIEKATSTASPKDNESYISPLYNVAITQHHVPVVFRPEYNISLFGLEKLHPFDSGKWGKIIQLLKEKGLLKDKVLVKPLEATKSDLLRVHKQRYLTSLKWSVNVAKITELSAAALLPNCLLQRKLLRPFRYQTGGSVVAGRCAVERGWSINVGGGFHHCSAGRGGGFCAYADITLLINVVLEQYSHINNVMIVDLDAHQGNGHERDFMGREDVYIMDVYNRLIYPRDEQAKKAINKRIELSPFAEDPRYLQAVEEGLEQCLQEFTPDLVVYNAGTDVLDGDPLGLLSVSNKGVILRDEIVWQTIRQQHHIPLVMLTSGGYQRSTAAVVADSIANLQHLGLVDLQCSQPSSSALESGSDSCKKSSVCSSSSPPQRYPSLLSRCGGKKKSSVVSGSESSTPLSGRHSTTDSTTSSPPPHAPSVSQQPLPEQQETMGEEHPVAPGKISSTIVPPQYLQSRSSNSDDTLPPPAQRQQQQQPPLFINIKPSEYRRSVASACSADFATPRGSLPPPSLTSPCTPMSGLHPNTTRQASVTDSVTPPSPAYRSVTDSVTPPTPAYRSVAGSLLTVNTSSPHTDKSPPLHHTSIDSTLSLHNSSITSPPSHYQSADSISSSLANQSVFMPP